MKKTSMAAIGIIAVFACLLLCTPALANNNFTDLNVTKIELNCGGYLFGNESNEICAKIENTGSGDAGAFNVSFVIDGFSEEVRINGLAAGENTTVCVNDTTSRNAGDSVTITVTADCNGAVTESDETNNESTMATTVVNNGYKGKRYTGGEDIMTVQNHAVNGNLVYSVGDSYYLSGSYTAWYNYIVNWTASDLPIPSDATIEKARLYVYYTWDKVNGMPNNVSLTFNGHSEPMDAFYTDRKGYGSYDYPSGMLAYNVTADFDTSGNTAILKNLNPAAGNPAMYGMLLVVIYEKNSELPRLIWINEGCDILAAKDAYCVNSTEATAFAPFAGTIDTGNVKSATLITVAPSGSEGDDKNRLYFNDVEWQGIWDSFAGDTQLGINETDVKGSLSSTGNLARFQSHIPEGETKGDFMLGTNAFLILTKAKISEEEYQKKIIQPVDVNKIRYKFKVVDEEWAAKWTNEILYVQMETKYSIAVYLNKTGYVTGVDFERWGFPIAEIPVELAAQSLVKLDP